MNFLSHIGKVIVNKNMEHKIILKEKIKIKDSMAWELEVDAIIFRDEFNYYLEKFKKDGSEKTLVFVFIMLQIYVEYFLHQNMRRVISLEFKHNDKSKYEEWTKEESERFKVNKKLSHFIQYFSLENNNEIIVVKEEIEIIFKEITDIRNLLVHGHKISLAGNTDSSDIEVSETRGYLDKDILIEVIANINQLGKNWNNLLDLILSECKALRKIDDFKFSNLDYK